MEKNYFLWEYLENETPMFFSRENIVQIEKAYLGNASLELAPKTVIDFTKMVISKAGNTFPIRRILLDSSIAAMTNKGGLWQYMGDNGKHLNYSADIDKILETAYKTGQAKRGIFVNKKFFIINFMNMQQHNPISGSIRGIKRADKNDFEESKLNAIWVWLDDYNVYLPYDLPEMIVLETKYQKKNMKFKLEFNSFVYTINFANMTQCNVDSNRFRSIRRIPLNLLSDPIIWEYQTTSGFVPYDSTESEFIEKAYQSRQQRYSGTNHSLNFKAMTWTDTKKKGKIQRVNQVTPTPSEYLWQYLSDNGYVSYSSELNKSIEIDYQAGKSSFVFIDKGVLYTLHFDTMEQEDVKNQYYRAVRRINDRAIKWQHYKSLTNTQSNQTNYSVIELNNESTEYEIVKTYFDKSMKEKYKVIKIMKVKNLLSKSLYKGQLNKYEKEVKKQPLVLLLFYGKKDVSPFKILDSSLESFDRQCSVIEDRCGKGIYFSSKASIICNGNQYTEGNKNYIIFAQVIVGEPQDFYTTTSKKPNLNAIKAQDLYIISEANMAYPKYLIEYIE